MKRSLFLMMALMLSAQLVAAPDTRDVLKHYADIAFAGYSDALTSARAL